MTLDRVLRVLTATALGLLLLAAGCSPSHDRAIHTDGDGPLSLQAGSGGTSVAAPEPLDGSSWFASFGGFFPCSSDGRPLVIDAVTAVTDRHPPAGLQILHRTAIASEDHLFYSAYGAAPEADGERVSGEFSDEVEGVRVELSCDADVDLPDLTELVVVVESGPEGAHVESLSVDYHAADSPSMRFTLVVELELITCGPAIDHEMAC